MGILNQLVMNAIIAGAAYAILALGFNVIFGITKFLNMAYGAVAVVGAYGVFLFCRLNSLPLWLGIPLAIIAAGIVSYLSDVLVFRKLRRRKAVSLVHVVASLGLMLLLQAATAIFFTSQYQGLADQNSPTPVYAVAGASITSVQIITVITALAVLFGLALVLKKSAFGRAIRAISDDEEVSKIIGINTDHIISMTFFLGGAIAGLAGILVGFDVGISPTMGREYLSSTLATHNSRLNSRIVKP